MQLRGAFGSSTGDASVTGLFATSLMQMTAVHELAHANQTEGAAAAGSVTAQGGCEKNSDCPLFCSTAGVMHHCTSGRVSARCANDDECDAGYKCDHKGVNSCVCRDAECKRLTTGMDEDGGLVAQSVPASLQVHFPPCEGNTCSIAPDTEATLATMPRVVQLLTNGQVRARALTRAPALPTHTHTHATACPPHEQLCVTIIVHALRLWMPGGSLLVGEDEDKQPVQQRH